MAISASQLTWLQGEALAKGFETSPGAHRLFCTVCGTRLMTILADQQAMGVPVALFDNDTGVRPQLHVFVGSKAPWFEISDNLPQYLSAPPPGRSAGLSKARATHPAEPPSHADPSTQL